MPLFGPFASENTDKKAVRARDMRGRAEEFSHSRRQNAQGRLAPDGGRRTDAVPGMTREEVRDSRFVFGRQQRTCGVDDAPARPRERGRFVEKVVLDPLQFLQAILREPPAEFGLAPPGARAAARRIDEDGIERALGRLAFPRLDDRDTRAHGPWTDLRQTARIDITGDDRTLVLHLSGKRESLPARARREIENPLIGPGMR